MFVKMLVRNVTRLVAMDTVRVTPFSATPLTPKNQQSRNKSALWNPAAMPTDENEPPAMTEPSRALYMASGIRFQYMQNKTFRTFSIINCLFLSKI